MALDDNPVKAHALFGRPFCLLPAFGRGRVAFLRAFLGQNLQARAFHQPQAEGRGAPVAAEESGFGIHGGKD